MRIVHSTIALLLITGSSILSWYLINVFGAISVLAPLKYATIPIIALAITAGQLIFKFSDLVTSPGLNHSQISSLRQTISSKRRKLYFLCALYFLAGVLAFISSAIIASPGIPASIAYWLGIATLLSVTLSFVFTPYILVWHHEISEFYMQFAEQEEKRKAQNKQLNELNQEKDWSFESDESIERYNQINH